MFSRWPIRNKILLGMALLLAMIVVLCFSGLYGLYAYGGFVDSLRYVEEFRLATDIEQSASRLRVEMASWRPLKPATSLEQSFAPQISFAKLPVLRARVQAVREAINHYRELQANAEKSHTQLIGGNLTEAKILWNINESLNSLDQSLDNLPLLPNEPEILEQMKQVCRRVHEQADQVPGMLQAELMAKVDVVRERYRTLIRLAWTALISTLVGVGLVIRLVSKSVMHPIRALAAGSRRIASGDYSHHVTVNGTDEFSELGKALNEMTDRFLLVRDDLDQQVRQRTAQIVRGERLAGVGFLAAGVSHEINNPLASIAMCAESLESRLYGLRDLSELDEERQQIVERYLTMIRSEAERCEKIAQKLFDMSQIGDARREVTDLHKLVREVVDVLRPIKQYHGRTIEIKCTGVATAAVDPGEIKQVVMNLLTNALEHIAPGGRVWLSLVPRPRFVELEFRDNGAGMSEDVKRHLFEPFFTRRLNGGGTGLGLSVVHRIISAHGGEIAVDSAGPGEGSTFRVRLPRRISGHPGQASHTLTTGGAGNGHGERRLLPHRERKGEQPPQLPGEWAA